jgi:5-methylcytosine-specific restriction enzyme subunit McrC
MARILRVLEHSTLTIGDTQGVGEEQAEFLPEHWEKLLRYHDTGHGRRYYDIRHRAVRFKHYVGVLQAGNLTIEVLPKVDAVPGASTSPDEPFDRWRRLLLHLLAEAGLLPVDSFNTALLRERENTLLDLYLDLFLMEVEALLRRGLIKRYRQHEGQVKALRGTLLFGQHIARNVVHQERFYTRHQTYDRNHLAHSLIQQALQLIPSVTTTASLRGRATRALVSWPDVNPVRPTAAHFARLRTRNSRQTAPYRSALGIARLLLLRLSPDVLHGSDELIALFFNMNRVWENYLLRTLQRLLPSDWTVTKPPLAIFWQASPYQSQMQPDLLLTHATHAPIVLDAKWKRPAPGQPNPDDLRQLFAYAQHYRAKHTRLLYPQAANDVPLNGNFEVPLYSSGQLIQCGISYVGVGALSIDAGASDIDTSGYLYCSLGAELLSWLELGN